MDLSLTATGIATASGEVCLRPPDPTRGKRTRTADDNLQRLLWFRASLARLLNTERPELVVIEDYSGGHSPNQHTGVQLGELGGIVKVMLAVARVPIVLAASSQRQTYATGRGNAPKAEVLVAARERFGYTGLDDNEADAFILRHMGCDGMGQPLLEVPQTHRRALDKIEWPVHVSRAAI